VCLSSTITLIATSGPVSLTVATIPSGRHTIELAPFDAITLWPHTMYSFVSRSGELLELSRSSSNATATAAKFGIADVPPQSGFMRHPASGATALEDGHWITLRPEVCPGFELRHMRGFTSNDRHYHETFAEAYHVVQGSMQVRLALLSGESFEQRVSAGETVVIPKNTIHHVLDGSPDNEVLVSYWPRFRGDSDTVRA